MAFFGAQTFLLDSSTVNQAAGAYLSKVSLFFKNKPTATGNRSGIDYPGVTVFIAPTQDGVPVIGDVSQLPLCRLEYNDVRPSGDASVATDFKFSSLPVLSPGKTYGIVLKFDGDDDFQVWTSVQGDVLLGTANTVSSGPTGQYVGGWFDYVSAPPVAGSNPVSSNLSSSAISSAVPVVVTAADGTSWKTRAAVDLKFSVSVARFAHKGSSDLTTLVSNTLIPPSAVITPSSSGVSVDANTGVWTFVVPSTRYEFVQYDPHVSSPESFSIGARAWLWQPPFPSSQNYYTVSVAAGSSSVTHSMGSALDFTSMFGQGPDPSYIVLYAQGLFIREVVNVVNSTVMIVDSPFTTTSSSASFYKTVAGTVCSIVSSREDAADVDFMVLTGSSANSTLRFANSRVESITVVAGGTGYSNGDVIWVGGYQDVAGKVTGGNNAVALLTTNSTGGIVSTAVASTGAGFSNSSSIVVNVYNSNAMIAPSAGSGANLVPKISMTLCAETSTGAMANCSNCSLVNPGVTEALFLRGDVVNPMGTFLSAEEVLSYYRVADSSVVGGYRYHVDSSVDDNDVFSIRPNVTAWPALTKSRVFPSWSNELIITSEANGAVQTFSGSTGTTNSAITVLTAASNNDFTMVTPGQLSVNFSHYQINDDYDGENTDQGGAASRGLSNRVTLAAGSYAEDALLWIDMWRPAGTDVQAFLRVQNDADPESFDDKDWTRLQATSGATSYSSTTDQTDLIQMGFSLPLYPNSALTISGTATTSNGSSSVTGSGTNFTQLANGDVVKIYNPLFSETDHFVVMVETVSSDTSITLSEPIANSGIVGSGMKVDKIAYPHQAFNNIMNENVVRYYTESGGVFDKYNVMQLKVVLLSPDYLVVPKLDNVRLTAVSS